MEVGAKPPPRLRREDSSHVSPSCWVKSDLICRSEQGKLPLAERHMASCGCTWYMIFFLLLSVKHFFSIIVQSSETLEYLHLTGQEMQGMSVIVINYFSKFCLCKRLVFLDFMRCSQIHRTGCVTFILLS